MKLEIEIHFITEDQSTWPDDNTYALCLTEHAKWPDLCFRHDDMFELINEEGDFVSVTHFKCWFTMPEVKRP